MTDLKKKMTLYGLTMVAIGSCVGSGIFLTPSQIAGHVVSPSLILIVWGVGGIMALSGALTFAELGARFPAAGGIYVFLREGYNNLFAFLYGWCNILVVNTGAIAALSLGFASYTAYIFPMGEMGKLGVAIGGIVLVTLINIFGVKKGEGFSNLFTGLKLLGIIGIIFLGLAWGKGSMNTYEFTVEPISGSWVSAIGLALIGVIFSYGGFQHASFLAGEAKDPKRNIPLSMIMGTLVVTTVYLLTNLAYLFLLPADQLSASEDVAARAITTIIPEGGVIIAAIIAISCLGTAGIYTLSVPRIYFAMAKDGVFFKKLATLHPKYQTPVNAILMQSTWAIVLLLFWGSFADLITYVLFTDWIFLTLAAISIFIFRIRGKENSQFKTLGYPITPLVFIGLSLFLLGNTLIEKPTHAIAGLGLLLCGIPFYFLFRSLNKKNQNHENS